MIAENMVTEVNIYLIFFSFNIESFDSVIDKRKKYYLKLEEVLHL